MVTDNWADLQYPVDLDCSGGIPLAYTTERPSKTGSGRDSGAFLAAAGVFTHDHAGKPAPFTGDFISGRVLFAAATWL